jgi:hypothetical protein
MQFVGVLAIVLVLSLVIGLSTPGYEDDIAQAKTWARQLVRNGIHDAYRTDTDGAPILLHVIAAVGRIYRSTIDADWSEQAAQASDTLSLMLKAPMIVAHLGITAVLFLVAASANSTARLSPAAVALAYGANPATLYDAAHFGQTDPLAGLVAAVCLAALHWRSAVLLGIGAAAMLLGKPQGWILLPLIAAAAVGRFDLRRLAIGAVCGVLTLAVVLSPWILTGRANHFWRYVENLSGHDISNRVISADAHNLWWIPTLVHGDWIEDSVPFIGPLSYRVVAASLALIWLAYCFIALRRSVPGGVGLVAAAASFGFFMLMTRAHENHSYLAVVLLISALAIYYDGRIWAIFGIVSVGLLANLVLRDPLVMGLYTSVPDPGQEAPPFVMAAQVANIAVFGAALVMIARQLGQKSSPLRP